MMQKHCTARQPITVNHVERFATRYGLTRIGPRTTDDRMLRSLVWIVEDMADEPFNEPVVPWASLVTLLAGDHARGARELACRDYTSTADHRTVAQWFLAYCLNHLDGSGLAVVRLP